MNDQSRGRGQMTGISIARPGGPEVLVASKYEIPVPGESELLVRVVAAGVNRVDALQRSGGFPPPAGAPNIPGVEISGEVVSVGAAVSRYRPGDQVCGLVAGGGYAEYAIVPEATALPIPRGIDIVDAGGLPEIYFTVWMNLVDRGHLSAGETLLVHGGTSGIGTAAVQLARAIGATVFATAGSDEKCAVCVELGAARAINYRTEDFVEVVRAETNGRGVDVILDIVAGDYVRRNYEAAAQRARILQVGFMENRAARIDVLTMMYKSLIHAGASLRPEPLRNKAAIARSVETHVWPLLADGKLRPITDTRISLANAADAHRRLEASAHIGKILLLP